MSVLPNWDKSGTWFIRGFFLFKALQDRDGTNRSLKMHFWKWIYAPLFCHPATHFIPGKCDCFIRTMEVALSVPATDIFLSVPANDGIHNREGALDLMIQEPLKKHKWSFMVSRFQKHFQVGFGIWVSAVLGFRYVSWVQSRRFPEGLMVSWFQKQFKDVVG